MSYYKKVRVNQADLPSPAMSSAGPWPMEIGSSPFPSLPSSTPSTGSLLGGFKNMNWQQIVDQMGGIDGVINRLSQIQKLVSTVQQFAPMLKMFSGSLAQKGPLATTEDLPDADRAPVYRKRRRKSAPAVRRKRLSR